MFFVLNSRKNSGAKGKKYLPWTPSTNNEDVSVWPSSIDRAALRAIIVDIIMKIIFLFREGITLSVSLFLAE